jgi:hypothetical protein
MVVHALQMLNPLHVLLVQGYVGSDKRLYCQRPVEAKASSITDL